MSGVQCTPKYSILVVDSCVHLYRELASIELAELGKQLIDNSIFRNHWTVQIVSGTVQIVRGTVQIVRGTVQIVRGTVQIVSGTVQIVSGKTRKIWVKGKFNFFSF